MTISKKERLKKYLQKLNDPHVSFMKVFNKESRDEYEEILDGSIEDIEELELLVKVHERMQFIIDEFVES